MSALVWHVIQWEDRGKIIDQKWLAVVALYWNTVTDTIHPEAAVKLILGSVMTGWETSLRCNAATGKR
jgi:hypothetical protein